MVPNIGAVLKKVEHLLPSVQATLDRVETSVQRLDARAEQLDRLPEIERELAALRALLEDRRG